MTTAISTSESHITCPTCRHYNLSQRIICELCHEPLRKFTADAHHMTLYRPGCLTAYALLMGIVGLVAVPVGFVAWRAQETGIFFFAALTAIVQIPLGWGLWHQKDWSRKTVIILQGFNVVLSLFWLPESIISLIVSGVIIHWFATNEEYFG